MSQQPSDFLVSPIDLKIHQDWSQVLPLVKDLITRSKTQTSEQDLRDYTMHYHMGLAGSVGHHYVSDDWNHVISPILLKRMTWLSTLLDDMAELGPKWCINIMNGNAYEHIDYATTPVSLVYPINTTSAFTWVKYEEQEYGYPSIADQPWILNTQFIHGVRNTESRMFFNMHFAKEFPIVKAWFDARPGLTYGEPVTKKTTTADVEML